MISYCVSVFVGVYYKVPYHVIMFYHRHISIPNLDGPWFNNAVVLTVNGSWWWCCVGSGGWGGLDVSQWGDNYPRNANDSGELALL